MRGKNRLLPRYFALENKSCTVAWFKDRLGVSVLAQMLFHIFNRVNAAAPLIL